MPRPRMYPTNAQRQAAYRQRVRKRQPVYFRHKADDWETPDALFAVLHREFHFTTDVAALPHNAKCADFFTPGQDGLRQTWHGVCWMNPPYGKVLRQWIRKAYESAKAGALVVCLLPARTDTVWWHDYVLPCAELRYIRGRVQFNAGIVPPRFLKKGEQEEAVRKRIANAKATAGNMVRAWEIWSETDPASGAKVPRTASIVSDDGLCQLQVEERMNGTRLASIVCSGLKIAIDRIEVKFDNRPKSDEMRIERFSNSRDVFIPSNQWSHLAYDEFLRRITEANKVALLLTIEGAGQHWMTFSLTGSGPALTKIGALDSKPRK